VASQIGHDDGVPELLQVGRQQVIITALAFPAMQQDNGFTAPIYFVMYDSLIGGD
jgi:hypothetical protein